jgi:hypothetical protein
MSITSAFLESGADGAAPRVAFTISNDGNTEARIVHVGAYDAVNRPTDTLLTMQSGTGEVSDSNGTNLEGAIIAARSERRVMYSCAGITNADLEPGGLLGLIGEGFRKLRRPEPSSDQVRLTFSVSLTFEDLGQLPATFSFSGECLPSERMFCRRRNTGDGVSLNDLRDT